MGKTYDVVVLGAGPAGCAAAIELARGKHKTALVDAPHTSASCALAEWAPADFFGRSGLPRSVASACGAEQFRSVRYYNRAFDKQSVQKSGGWFLQTAALAKTLQAAARSAGAAIVRLDATPAIRLAEEVVELTQGKLVRAKLLLVAHGRPNDVVGDLALPMRTVPQSNINVAALEMPLGAKNIKSLRGALHVFEMPDRSQLGMMFVCGQDVHIRLMCQSTVFGNHATELTALISRIQGAGLLPAVLPFHKARGTVWNPPAGVALELDTHIAKRCILAGTAGGFADSITGQVLAPSVRSAVLAAQVVDKALKHEDPQKSLMRFKTLWRESLSDRLSPPNTSLQMLLPLLFVNKRIVGRFTQALLYGKNI